MTAIRRVDQYTGRIAYKSEATHFCNDEDGLRDERDELLVRVQELEEELKSRPPE